WQWIRHGATLDSGETMTKELFTKTMAEELDVVRGEVGEARWTSGRFDEAAELMSDLCTNDEFATFLTLGAYKRL
ncbi:MAG: malate synthase A, partial [Parvularcula sp.]